MANVWFTSDLHLAHPKVAELRGFASTKLHDAAIMGNLAATLGKNDALWILGDISSGTNRSEREALDQLAELTVVANLHLVLGNHDTPHPMHCTTQNAAKYLEVFNTVQERGRRKFTTTQPTHGERAKKVWLSHFPYFGNGDRGEDERYSEVRLHDAGDYLLHGHLHTRKQWTAPRSIHVGLDAWELKPVHHATIQSMIDKREKALSE
jgi:calcineurin-like phosphoesterase family protein